MNEINTGGPAFPHVADVIHMDGNTAVVKNYTQGGMTLRDYFAAKAMQGFCANPANRDALPGEIAKGAHLVADAMLKVREQS